MGKVHSEDHCHQHQRKPSNKTNKNYAGLHIFGLEYLVVLKNPSYS